MAAALVAVAVMAGLTFASPAHARTDDRTKEVWFVHGYDRYESTNCGATFAEMRRRFSEWGFSGYFRTVGYYHGDYNGCDTLAHGFHHIHWGDAGNHRNGAHTAQTSIRHLAYHFAWHLYEKASRHGRTVDIVAHSMGGLITRYAIALTEEGHSDFPPYLRVEDVVTMGTPHGGARHWAHACGDAQCNEMVAGSRLLQDLENGPSGWDPDAPRGGDTDWSTFGSDDDSVVAADRAAATADDGYPYNDYMSSCHKIWYTTVNDIEHSDFRTDSSSADSAVGHRYDCNNGGSWIYSTKLPWPVRRAARALTWGTE
jgi:hypothetical protein